MRDPSHQLELRDQDCVRFLQETLPELGYRWAGFRRVRGQVRKRLRRRIEALGLADLEGYRARLAADPAEREVFDGLCRISISRFHRDRRVFETLRSEVLPLLAKSAREVGEPLRCWSAGCASGEEPYSLALAWQLDGLAEAFPQVALRVLASDASPHMLQRARAAEYTAGSLRDLPPAWRVAFAPCGDGVRLRESFRAPVALCRADVRDPPPGQRFRLVLCRYLVFTYFSPELQAACLEHLLSALAPGGFLVVAPKEDLPPRAHLQPHGEGRLGIYRRVE